MSDAVAGMSATVLSLSVVDGTRVRAGEVIAILESMKMEIPVEAPSEGVVRFRVKEKSEVAEGTVIAQIS